MLKFTFHLRWWFVAILSIITFDLGSVKADENINRSALVSKIQSIATAQWFAKKCDGLILVEQLPAIDYEKLPATRISQETTEKLSKNWEKMPQSQLKPICLKSLILFGPKGTQMPGLLTATPALQESLPIDTRKLIGF